jgi:hypothetical protein
MDFSLAHVPVTYSNINREKKSHIESPFSMENLGVDVVGPARQGFA